ncbi:carboxy terminal-processing peptidase [Solitalea canadensis]|uniref:C-terminal processing peptidase n=1 Tax=Solitalea canadensis (strain ATCC 29591 / DSM 3403 / JCM 21819 / LMG 8368 / NBRC 15130 / NCIMB 12057 / USAM 9D) TaxID=929556 RepID=H8KUV3_SOLCM|nr:carboxy terminal-processing peptidase [Solitalea canadensis]AFD07653.1 C-terminal processing peptidase [Solitalea canadensis DSM 3403]
MKFKLIITAVLAGVAGQCMALSTEGPDKYIFKQEPQQANVAKMIANAIANYHYKKTRIDDSLSNRIYIKYLNKLDKSHVFLQENDIKAFEQYRYQFDDELQSGNLDGVFEIYSTFVNRLNERVAFALNELKKTQSLSTEETFLRSRENEKWFTSEGEADEYWNKRIRYELILSKINEHGDEQKALKIITARYQKLKRNIETFKSENAFESFMNAATESIDPHSNYFSPKNAVGYMAALCKSMDGIGVTIGIENDYPVIKQIVKGGPAANSGQIEVNDRIVAIAQGDEGSFEDVVGWSIEEVVAKTRGVRGSKVRLQMLSSVNSPANQMKEVILIRDKIRLEDQKVKSEINSVHYNNRDYKVGIISIPNFYLDNDAMQKGEKDYASTSNDVKKVLADFKNQGVSGVMIDLRNNGGGSFKEAVELSGLFITSGPIVQVRDANNKVMIQNDPDAQQIYDGPLTILINRNSASASEIFSAAMQDYQRGVLIGEQSFGKGSVQRIYSINELLKQKDADLGLLTFTIAKYYRVNGSSTQLKGVTPDIAFPTTIEIKYGEKTMQNALPFDQIQAVSITSVSNLERILPKLNEHHLKRLHTNIDYKYWLEDQSLITKKEGNKKILLDERSIKSEQEEQEESDFERYIAHRAAMGLAPVAQNEKRPKIETDFIKNEGLTVTADLIEKYKSN